jgi:hypothetical protein
MCPGGDSSFRRAVGIKYKSVHIGGRGGKQKGLEFLTPSLQASQNGFIRTLHVILHSFLGYTGRAHSEDKMGVTQEMLTREKGEVA